MIKRPRMQRKPNIHRVKAKGISSPPKKFKPKKEMIGKKPKGGGPSGVADILRRIGDGMIGS